MNYRHAFHAGNFADCMKHALLVWLMQALQRKPAGIYVLDTHAGAGRYAVGSGPAERTQEWRQGIGRVLDDAPLPLESYVSLVRRLGLYPGSPALLRALLRPGDRLACCELHPEDATALKRLFPHDRQVAVHRRDGWEALGALLPPAERRGLILIDPPFEQPDEFTTMVQGLRTGYQRFRTGVFAAWYPIKHRTPVRLFHTSLRESGLRDIVAAELLVREPLDPSRLNGCGLAVVNSPFGFEAAASVLLEALLGCLGNEEPGAATSLIRIVNE